MSGAILTDIWLGFRGQLRRSPWGVLLLWTGMTVATIALVIGFGLAESVYMGLMSRLPGDMELLCYVEGMVTVASPSGRDPAHITWKGFSLSTLDGLIQDGLATGYFAEVKGRPIRVMDQNSREVRQIRVDALFFAGNVPLYGGVARGTLARVQEQGGVAGSQALAAGSIGAQVGDLLLLSPVESRPLVALVGPASSLDPVPTILIPLDRNQGTGGEPTPNRVGIYLAPGADAAGLKAQLESRIGREQSGVQIVLTPGEKWHEKSLVESRTVAGMAVGIALLMALVAFVNSSSFATQWVWNRAHGLALRRALGLTPQLTTLYVIADQALIAATAVVTGLALVLVADVLWFRPLQIPAVTAGSIVTACLIMGAGTAVVGGLLATTVNWSEPGSLLGRGL